MTRYIMDSGSVSDFINRRGSARDRVARAIKAGARVGLGSPVLGELYGGLEISQTRDRNLTLLRKGLGKLAVWPFDEGAAREYGRVFAMLRRIGRAMQQIDMQTAAIAFALGSCTVVSKDSDLFAVPGLKVENWL